MKMKINSKGVRQLDIDLTGFPPVSNNLTNLNDLSEETSKPSPPTQNTSTKKS